LSITQTKTYESRGVKDSKNKGGGNASATWVVATKPGQEGEVKQKRKTIVAFRPGEGVLSGQLVFSGEKG